MPPVPMRKKRCCAKAGAPASPRALKPAPKASASRRVIIIMSWSSQVHFRKLALGSRPLSIVPASACGVDARGRTWFDDRMSQHASIDLGAMISGIQRWVETESPTSSKAAVNRMVDHGAGRRGGPARDGRARAGQGRIRRQSDRAQPGAGERPRHPDHVAHRHSAPDRHACRAAPLPPRRRQALRARPVRHEGRSLSGARGVPAGRARGSPRSCRSRSCSRRTRRSAARPRAT